MPSAAVTLRMVARLGLPSPDKTLDSLVRDEFSFPRLHLPRTCDLQNFHPQSVRPPGQGPGSPLLQCGREGIGRMSVGMEHDVAVLHRVQGGQHAYIHLRQAPAMKEITQVSRPEKAEATQTSHDMGEGGMER